LIRVSHCFKIKDIAPVAAKHAELTEGYCTYNSSPGLYHENFCADYLSMFRTTKEGNIFEIRKLIFIGYFLQQLTLLLKNANLVLVYFFKRTFDFTYVGSHDKNTNY